MARAIKQGQSIYIPFVNGESVFDSQNRPRMYKSVEQFQKSYPAFRLEKPKLVEYAPVVRCKDCIHLTHGGKTKDGTLYFPQCIYSTIIPLKPDDFCSYGKRRLENE